MGRWFSGFPAVLLGCSAACSFSCSSYSDWVHQRSCRVAPMGMWWLSSHLSREDGFKFLSYIPGHLLYIAPPWWCTTASDLQSLSLKSRSETPVVSRKIKATSRFSWLDGLFILHKKLQRKFWPSFLKVLVIFLFLMNARWYFIIIRC